MHRLFFIITLEHWICVTRISYLGAVTTPDAELRSLSAAAFGQQLRLEVMLTILELDAPVCLTDLAAHLQVNPSSIQRPFASLIHLGLIARSPHDGTRRHRYEPTTSAAWDWARELATQGTTKEGSPGDRRAE